MSGQTLQPLRSRPELAAWCSFGGLLICALVLLAALAQRDWLLAAQTRSIRDVAPQPQSADWQNEAGKVPDASDATEHADFVSTLSRVSDPDAIIRFASKLARDQDVHVFQMQSEGVIAGVNKLPQTKFALQLRGDYRNIKNVMIGLLAKFPGLTLMRLTVHHRDAAGGGLTGESRDETTLELLQYLRPAANH